jgi:hypothetical protein
MVLSVFFLGMGVLAGVSLVLLIVAWGSLGIQWYKSRSPRSALKL